MNTNNGNGKRVAREDMAVEMLMEQGRLLHSRAVYDICATAVEALSQMLGNSSREAGREAAPGLAGQR